MPGLTVGRIVHFVDVCGKHKAAIVAAVSDAATGTVDLAVFGINHQATWQMFNVVYEESGSQVGTWHWIERA